MRSYGASGGVSCFFNFMRSRYAFHHALSLAGGITFPQHGQRGEGACFVAVMAFHPVLICRKVLIHIRASRKSASWIPRQSIRLEYTRIFGCGG